MAENLFRKRRNLVQSAASKPRPQNQGPVQPFVNQTNNDLEGYIQYAESYGQVPLFSGASEGRTYRNLVQSAAPTPRSFNPQNQGVSARASAAPANRPSPTAERTEWDALGDLNAEDPSWVLRRRAERTLGDQVRGMMDQNSQEPRALNPQNQDVLARASAALDAVKQDRLNPMGGQGSPGLRGFVDSVGSGLASAYNSVASALTAPPQMYAGPMENVRPERLSDLQDTPGFRFSWNGAGSGDVPNLADALNDPQPSNPIRSGYAPAGRGPVPRSVASQAPNYYQQQAAGMDAESVRRRDLAGQIDALRQRSQRDNPMAPQAPAYDPMQAEIVQGRRQDQFMSNARIAGSSGEAGVTARSIPGDLYNPITARPANRYDGMVQSDRDQTRMTPNEKLELAERSAGRYMQGGAAADPTNMRGRFGGTALDEYNATGMSWQDRERAAEFAADAPNRDRAQQVMMQKRAEREAERAANPVANAERLQRIADATAARKAKHEEFKANNGGMNYGQARRAERQTGLKQRSFDKAVIKGMNPFGPEAQARFPNQVAAAKGGQNQAAPAAVNPIFGPGAPNTVENIDARATARQANVQSSPTLSAWGVSPDLDPSGFAQTVGQNLFTRQPDGKFGFAEVSDDGIKSIFNQVKLFDPTGDGKPPFPEGSIYNQMWGLPEDTPPAELRKMFEAMLANMNSVPQAPMGQAGRTYGKL